MAGRVHIDEARVSRIQNLFLNLHTSYGSIGGGYFRNSRSEMYACDREGCNMVFSNNFELGSHILNHPEERRFQCTTCNRRFLRQDHLQSHQQVHIPIETLHTCDRCQKMFYSRLSYRRHVALHAAKEGELECQICGNRQPNRAAIIRHVKTHPGSRTPRDPSEKKYPCRLCDRSFFTKKDVKRHLVVHTKKREFVFNRWSTSQKEGCPLTESAKRCTARI